MVIEKIINQKGAVDHPEYTYDYETKTYTYNRQVTFFYQKVYIIDGVTFLLGSLKKGSRDSLLEKTTGSIALRREYDGDLTDENILRCLKQKLNRHVCKTLYDVIVYFQNSRTMYKTEAWQINLMIL